MIKKLFFAAACCLAFTNYMNAEVVLANFDGVLDASALSVEGTADNASTVSVVANPDNSGINTSENCMYFKQQSEATAWTRAVITLADAIEITDENRYLHIMAYLDIAQTDCGIKNDGDADFTWLGRMQPAQNTWVDVVYDLKDKKTSLIALAFSEWGIGTSNMYFDEIIINDNPIPRGASYTVVEGAATMANFENSGANDIFNGLSYQDAATGSLTIVENPAKSGINTTDYCLKDNRLKEWASSIGKIYVNDGGCALITNANRYLHVMVYAEENVDGLFFIRSGSSDDLWSYSGDSGGIERRFSFTANEWKDVVVDLGNIKTLYGLYLLSQDWSFAKERNFYYDEIILNDNPNARTVSQGTGLQQIQASNAVRAIDGGIALCGIRGNVKIYDVTGRTVADTYLENDMELTLNKGIYVVVAADIKTKVIVK